MPIAMDKARGGLPLRRRFPFLVVLLAVLSVAATLRPLAASARQPTPEIAAYDFKSDPAEAGWRLLPLDQVKAAPTGRWISNPQDPNASSLSVGNGCWQGPPFATVPHQYYRLTFRSKAQDRGYWAAMFYAADGRLLPADHNQGISKSDDWIDNEVYFQGKADAVTARLRFYLVSPNGGETIYIRDVRLSAATGEQVLDWSDRLYATIPAVQYQPASDRWALIPRTMQKLQHGEKLKMVLLGDSIGNDTGNAPLDKLIQRQFPGSKVEVITSVRGGTGCQYYQQPNRVQEYVVRYQPDVVMIIAICHGYDIAAIRSVVRQIHAECAAEIILTTGPISQESLMVASCAGAHNLSIEKATVFRQAFLDNVAQVAREEQVEFIPLRKLWNEYLATATPPHDVTWFLRDETHANLRGQQVVARLLEKYFAPKGAGVGTAR